MCHYHHQTIWAVVPNNSTQDQNGYWRILTPIKNQSANVEATIWLRFLLALFLALVGLHPSPSVELVDAGGLHGLRDPSLLVSFEPKMCRPISRGSLATRRWSLKLTPCPSFCLIPSGYRALGLPGVLAWCSEFILFWTCLRRWGSCRPVLLC
jgi:hypothetical protein